MTTQTRDLDERAFQFLCGVIRFVRTMDFAPGNRKIADQLVAASGSISANRQEATSASSRKEFIRFNEISLRSAKESTLWLRACASTGIGEPKAAESLLEEATQLSRILGAIVISSKRNG